MKHATLGTFVREARERAGSLRAVGARLGISASTLSRLESGHAGVIGPEALARLLDHLGLDRWDGFRLAGLADPELTAIVLTPSRALAELLRIAQGATDDDWAAALAAARSCLKLRKEPT